jgi:hypothetical protein
MQSRLRAGPYGVVLPNAGSGRYRRRRDHGVAGASSSLHAARHLCQASGVEIVGFGLRRKPWAYHSDRRASPQHGAL